jgi:alpha-tubulin suppressor-like RCC1 family protein
MAQLRRVHLEQGRDHMSCGSAWCGGVFGIQLRALLLTASVSIAAAIISISAPAAHGEEPHCPNTPGHSHALMWGSNGRGELDFGYRGFRESTPRTTLNLTNVKELQPGFQFSVALLGNCTLESWGSDFKQGLGDGIPNTLQMAPVPVSYSLGEHNGLHPLENVKQVSVAKGVEPHALALQYNGTVWTWGSSEFGERGNGERGFEAVAKSHEPEVAKPRYEPIQTPLTGVTQVASGGTRDYALRNGSKEGEVLAWGGDTEGELGIELAEPEKCNGEPSPGIPVPCSTTPRAVKTQGASGLEPLVGAEKIAVGNDFAYAVRSGGTEILGWGDDIGNQLMGLPLHTTSAVRLPWTPPSPIVEVSPGARDAFARLKNGEVWAWGDDARGQLGIPPAQLTEECARKEKCTKTPVAVSQLTHTVQIVAAEAHTYALKEEESGKRVIYSFGANGIHELLGLGRQFEGQQGPSTETSTPTPIEGLPSVAEAAGGATFGAALVDSAGAPPGLSLTALSQGAGFLVEWQALAEAYSVRWHPAANRKFVPAKETVCPSGTFCGGSVLAEHLAPETYDFILSAGPEEKLSNGEVKLAKKLAHPRTIAGAPEPPSGAPVSESPPTLPPLAQEGFALAATPGKWKNSPTSVKYQWLVCEGYGLNGTNEGFGEECEEIPGATSQTFTPPEADVGHTVVVTEKASNAASEPEKPTVAESEPVVVRGLAKDEGRESEPEAEFPPRVPPAPENTAPPRLSSLAEPTASSVVVGQALTVKVGEWFPEALHEPQQAPLTFDKWFRCHGETAEQELGVSCHQITEPKKEEKEEAKPHEGTEYVAREEDIGQFIEVQETAGNSGGSNTAVSNILKVEAAAPPANKKPPSIEAEFVQLDQKLTEVNGEWTNSPTEFQYQWERCTAGECKPIDEAEGTKSEKLAAKQTYKVQAGDENHSIRVREVASNKAGAGTPAYSAETSVVPEPPPAPQNTAKPKLSGNPVEGQAITIEPGKWSFASVGYTYPEKIEYQWQRCAMEIVNEKEKEVCHDVSGAAGKATTYVLTSEDVGYRIKVKESAVVPGSKVAVESEKIGPVAEAAPVNTKRPAIQGFAKQGQTLTEVPGAWKNTPTNPLEYQWSRCKGGSCEKINAATSQTYVLGAEDVGHTILVEERASNKAGGEWASSEATKEVLPHEPTTEQPPTIIGSAERGQTLTVSAAPWKYEPTGFSYQWERCTGSECQPIAGATSKSYKLEQPDVGHTIRVQETASNAGGFNREVSAQTAVVIVPAPVVTKIEPSKGPTAGSNTVTIVGEHLEEATTVEFGFSTAIRFEVTSSTSISAVVPAGTGTVNVIVSTLYGGPSKTSEADLYTYVPPPSVTSVEPARGKQGGGESVVISGENFEGARAVNFGSAGATSFEVLSPTSIKAVTPAGTGAVEVSVSTPYGTSAAGGHGTFTYVAPPAITKLEPSQGQGTGGTAVTITGTGFEEVTAVTFGSAGATSFEVLSPTSIKAVSPAGTGSVAVSVTTRLGGTSAANEHDTFTYLAGPTVGKVSPNSGTTAGGGLVTITGTNLAGASVVKFGATQAEIVALESSTKIIVRAPAEPAGEVDVTVTTPNGTSPLSTKDLYKYTPTITSIFPTSGPAAGGTSVTIVGTGFAVGATTIKFGGTKSSSVSCVSSTECVAVSPKHSTTGVVEVIATVNGVNSPKTAADQFTYV